MKNQSIRVRFAPAPTGMMHLGNIRTSLMNYLFARQKNGVFVLRIEDTDSDRNFDPGAVKIQEDLKWLGLTVDEGPCKNEQYGPYLQSERLAIYQKNLEVLINKGFVYQCFCSAELLEQKRIRLQALGKPPRYDRACLALDEIVIQTKLREKIPFIWRFKLNQEKTESINDLAKGSIDFEMKNFSDFPITRNDGSFTFIFANAIDDIAMKISHVFRGEEHITNTACQSQLFKALDSKTPLYWHMPLLCNNQGKKLSKRDFGFSLIDLQKDGFLAEAITNYLAIIGGGNFTKEILSLDELVQIMPFDQLQTSGHIKYDAEKLRWINRKWIQKIEAQDFINRVLPFFKNSFEQTVFDSIDRSILEKFILSIKEDISTLNEAPSCLAYLFDYANRAKSIKQEIQTKTTFIEFLKTELPITCVKEFLEKIKAYCAHQKIHPKELYSFIRFCLTGQEKGQGIGDICNLLGVKEINQRLSMLIN